MKSLKLVLILAAAVGVVTAADTKLPAPVAELPTAPADGSGYYHLTLEGLLDSASGTSKDALLLVYLEVRGGKVTAAAGRGPTRPDETYMSVDASGLEVVDGHLRGELAVVLPGFHDWRGGGIRTVDNKKKESPLNPPARGSVRIRLDLPMNVQRGAWTYTATTTINRQPQIETKGVVRLVREPLPVLGKNSQVHLYLPVALGKTYEGSHCTIPVMVCQVAVLAEMSDGKSTRLMANWASDGPGDSIPVTGDLLMVDGKLSGRIELRPRLKAKEGLTDQKPVTLEIASTVVGRWISGTAKGKAGDQSWQSPCLGRWRSDFWPIPLEMPTATWKYSHDLPADPELVAAGTQESLMPAMEGIPGERGFWTWRRLFVKFHNDSCFAMGSIRPLTFDFHEVNGATSYRFTVTELIADAVGRKSPKIFGTVVLDKPWKPLTAIWPTLQMGHKYTLTFEALDPQGKVLTTKLMMGIIGEGSAKPEEKEFTSIQFVRKPTFAGPYAKAPRGLNEAALDAARWSGEAPGYPRLNFNICGVYDNGGEASGSWHIGLPIWGYLAHRALAPTGAERAYAEENLDLFTDGLVVNQTIQHLLPPGLFYQYKGCIPLARIPGEAALDVWVETTDPRGKEMALKLGTGLASSQTSGGSWTPNHLGYFGWHNGFGEWGAAEMLYILGRIRRDCQTNQFREAEQRAYKHVMERQIKEMFWPVADHHSQSWAYPVPLYSEAAMYFIRYLLELAPPDKQNLALAEQLALWCEDLDIDWGLRDTPRNDRDVRYTTNLIFPRGSNGDRGICNPINNTSLFAVVCLHLHRATGKRLWLAKADALMTACIQSQDPVSGVVNEGMETNVSGSISNIGRYAKNLRDFSALRAQIQPAFAVTTKEKTP